MAVVFPLKDVPEQHSRSHMKKVFDLWYRDKSQLVTLDHLVARMAAQTLDEMPLQYVAQAVEMIRQLMSDLLEGRSAELSFASPGGMLLRFSVRHMPDDTSEISWRLSDERMSWVVGEASVLGQHQGISTALEGFPHVLIMALQGFFHEAILHELIS